MGIIRGSVIPGRPGAKVIEFEVRDQTGRVVSPIATPNVSAVLPEQGLGR